MRPILLTRLKASNNWTTQSPSTQSIGAENERRIRAEGGEAYNLSAEAIHAFFAVVPEARDLVRTSILSHERLFIATRSHMRASASAFLLLALIIGALIGQVLEFVRVHGFGVDFYPELGLGGGGIALALLAAWLLYRASCGFGELVERAHSRSPFLRSLRTQD